MALAITKEKRYTYGDYITWPNEERWELIDGIAYNMSPSPSRRHQEISRALFYQFYEYLKDKPCEVYYAPFDVRLTNTDERDEDICTVVQPDLLVVCDRNKLDEKGCRGVPDVIIEIVSPFSASKDLKEKFALYERHGVKEYWVVHPEEKIIMVFTLEEIEKFNRYGRPENYADKDKIEVKTLKGLIIDLSLVF